MLNTKLITLDGLPGSGKTTQAIWLESYLVQKKINVKRYHEFDRDHPVNWVAWWDGGFDALLRAYRQLPETMAYSLTNWHNFVMDCQNTNTIIILENLPLQNTVGLFLQGGADPAELIHYGMQVYDLIASLNPMMIHLYPSDIKWAFERICALRGATFENDVINNMERTPYFQHRALQGKEGIFRLWNETQALHRTLLDAFSSPILSIDFSQENWEQYQAQIGKFVDTGVSSSLV
jgi:hypothetical protein